MAAFDGVFPAGELQPAPCGLLSVATVVNHPERDDKWIRGYEVEATVLPTVRILSATEGEVTDGEISNFQGEPTHFPVVPFFVEVEIKTSGLNVLNVDPIAEARPQIEAATQKAVERELWEGLASRDAENDNIFLRVADGATILGGGAVHPKRAMAILEEAISTSPTGGAGTFHMTRGTASSIVGGGLSYIYDPEDQTNGAIHTSLGSPVVVGSGYTGNGPLGAAGAAADGIDGVNRWMYVTGPVVVHLGPPEVVNETLAQGFNASTNDSIVKVYRAASVHFDSSLFFAVQVTLPAIP